MCLLLCTVAPLKTSSSLATAYPELGHGGSSLGFSFKSKVYKMFGQSRTLRKTAEVKQSAKKAKAKRQMKRKLKQLNPKHNMLYKKKIGKAGSK